MTFSAKMLKRCSAPPENILNMPSSVPPCVEKNCEKRAASIPGTGMNVPIRYTTSAPKRNHSRWRISAKRAISPRAAGLVLDVATGLFLSLETPAGRLDRTLGALGRGNHLILDDVRLGDLSRQDDLHEFRAFGHQVGLDQARQRHIGAADAHQIGEGQLGA